MADQLPDGRTRTRLLQAKAEINLFIDRHLTDPSGALKAVLQTLVASADVYISRHLSAPLGAVREFLELLMGKPQVLYELVRQVDARSTPGVAPSSIVPS